MNINLVAKLKNFDDFINCYQEGDENKNYDGKNLLFFALSNNEPENRYLISSFLLDKGVDVNVTNSHGENLLHILLSRVQHNLSQTIELCERLIKDGADINQFDENGRVPFQYLIDMKYNDEELEPLYQIWFSQEKIILNKKNKWGKTPIELVKQVPYRASLLERLKKYEE